MRNATILFLALLVWAVTPTLDAQSRFIRADTNADGNADLSDGIATLLFLFQGGDAPTCLDAADSNDSGQVDLSDAVFSFNFLFLGGIAPPAPGFEECGPDPTEDGLSCESFEPCGVDPSSAIADARAQEDGPTSVLIEGAVITYLRPAVGGAPAGFFVQAEVEGPALLVEVDPDIEGFRVGDVLTFTIEEMDTVFDARVASAIADVSVTDQDFDVSTLIQDVSSEADLPALLNDLESELLRLEATLVDDFAFAGGGHVSVGVETPGSTGDIRVRVPETLNEELFVANDVGIGCDIVVTGPMWRFRDQAQPSGYVAEDIEIVNCPAPQPLSVQASSLTELVIQFNRQIDPASIADPNEDFVFSPAAEVQFADVVGREVTLTTSQLQPETEYTISISEFVTDLRGIGVDQENNTVTFTSLSLDPSEAIAAARAAPDGPIEIPIFGAVVTYIRPAVGSTPAGIFVQAEAEGPAIVVEVDPVTLVEMPIVGDVVDFVALEAGTIFDAQTIRAVENFEVTGDTVDVSTFVQDISNIDAVAQLNDLESELISLEATVAGDSAGAGGGHVSFVIDTAAVTGNSDLRIRIPTELADALGDTLDQTCTFELTGPMWRFFAQAQASAYSTDDIEVTSCPAPTVTGAEALSKTTVQVQFDRRIDPASIGDPNLQFTFEPPLNIVTSELNDDSITLETAPHDPVTEYTVTVDPSITDTLGSEVPEGSNTAMFTSLPADLAIQDVDFTVAALGARLVVSGNLFSEATGVSIGGEPQDFTIENDARLIVPVVSDLTPLGTQGLVIETAGGDTDPFDLTVVSLLISEVDADQDGTDAAEFVEVFVSETEVDLAGYTLVFFNGSNNTSYSAHPLGGVTPTADGLVWVGPEGFAPATGLQFPGATNQVQNGADAVALMQGDPGDLNGIPAAADGVIDAVVYDTNDSDATELLTAFFGADVEKAVQINEGENGEQNTESVQRCTPDRLDGRAWGTALATPGAENICP